MTLSIFDVQVVQAMCTLLGLVLPRVQTGVLRAKFVGASALFTSLLEEHRQQVCVCSCYHVCEEGTSSESFILFTSLFPKLVNSARDHIHADPHRYIPSITHTHKHRQEQPKQPCSV